MSHTSNADEILFGRRSMQDMSSLVRSLIDEVESHILLKDPLPEELFQGLYKTINDIEAKIVRRQAAQILAQKQIPAPCTENAASQSEWCKEVLSIGSTQRENGPVVLSVTNQLLARSQVTGTQDAYQGSPTDVRAIQDTLDSLRDSIQAIQSVVMLRMNTSMPSEASTTSRMVSFSILEEEMEILDGLLKHVVGSYKPSDDESCDLLETMLVALPTLLGALFNMEIREAVENGSEIDDKVMMEMVMANQRRTNVLRDVENIAKQVKDAIRTVQCNKREF
ncbi:hypothetical protein DHEL01_v207278 [Diaporthe helianthi]|uniref:Uncharacterized protein n=1 Tax=Diaporthe helianthi TaxID=158607 RepID=A0A2P5HVQ0_DIAHE|nr:hypothetical protein DHEL01_v207278 [Diaporthe helianthi]